MKKVILVTAHYHAAKRRAGFHWLANAYHQLGWDVLFFTAPISWISVMRGDYRIYDHSIRQHPIFSKANKLEKIAERFHSFVWFTPWHPTNLRFSVLNNLSKNFFLKYGNLSLGTAKDFIEKTDLVVFESTAAILLFDKFKQLNQSARYVYRVSDDMSSAGVHPLVLDYEQEKAPEFDLISVPSQYILENFSYSQNAKLHLHGIEKELFDADYSNPYKDFENQVNLVFVGNNFFDHDFLERASHIFPDWHFHIIGPIPNLLARHNITAYGKLPFRKTIAYIKYADIGLQNLEYFVGAEAFTHSLKTVQYTYCKLPVVSPDYLQTNMHNYFYYLPGDDASIKNALMNAHMYDRNLINTETILSWTELVQELAGA